MKSLCKPYFSYKLSLIPLGALCFLFGLPGSPMMSPVYANDGVNDGVAVVVTTTADRGPGSLRHTLLHAPSGATITFSVTGTILLESPLVINKDLTITGPGPDRFWIDGGNRSRLITVRNGPAIGLPKVVISGLRLSNGRVVNDHGGAIYNACTLEIDTCWIDSSSAVREDNGSSGGNGGAIYNIGELTITNSLITNNTAETSSPKSDGGNGGGLYNGLKTNTRRHGIVTIVNSTFSENTAIASPATEATNILDAYSRRRGLGGGVFNDCRLTPATNFRNIERFRGTIMLRHSTIARNTADFGGGLCNYLFVEPGKGKGEAEKVNAVMKLESTLVADNRSAGFPSCPQDAIGMVWADDSLVENASLIIGYRNILGLDPSLGPLADNGGPLPTHAPAFGSPAILGGAVPLEQETDATGRLRLAGIPSDIGAVQSDLALFTLDGSHTAALQCSSGGNVTVTLSGQGQGEFYHSLNSDHVIIRLSQTSMDSQLIIDSGACVALKELTVEGSMGSITAPETDLIGSLDVTGSLRSLALGDIRNPVSGRTSVSILGSHPEGTALSFGEIDGLTLTHQGGIEQLQARSFASSTSAPNIVKASWIGNVRIEGWLEKTRIMSGSDIASLEAGGMNESYILAGMRDGLVGMPLTSGDFLVSARIGNLSVTGDVKTTEGYSFIDTIIAGHTIDSIKLAYAHTVSEKPACGVGAKTIEQLDLNTFNEVTEGWQWAVHQDLDTPSDGFSYGDFYVAIYPSSAQGTDPCREDPVVPWSFAVLDDPRGGTIVEYAPSGTAFWNLGPMMADAYNSGAVLAFMPGDLVSAFNNYTNPDENGPDHQYQTFFRSTGFVTSPGHVGNLTIFRRPDDQKIPWAPYTVGDNFFPVRGNHEGYFFFNNTRDKWYQYFGQYVANASKWNPRVCYTSVGANPNAAGVDSRGFTFALEYLNSFFVSIDQYDTPHDSDGAVWSGFSYKQVPSLFCMENNTWLDPTGKQVSGNWLQSMLAYYTDNSSRLDHAYTFGHSPLYPTGDTMFQLGGENGHKGPRDDFVNLMNGVVDIYFCGHDHLYDHTTIRGTIPAKNYPNLDALHQILVGTAGADLDAKSKFDAPFSANTFTKGCDYSPILHEIGPDQFHRHDNKRMGYVQVTVRGKHVQVVRKAFDVDMTGDYNKVKARNQAFDSVWDYGP